MEIQESIEDSDSSEELNKIKNETLEKLVGLRLDLKNSFEEDNLDKVLKDLKLVKFNLTILENVEKKLDV